VAEVLEALERAGSRQFRADMETRYGIVTRDVAFGAPMSKVKAIAKPIGTDHALALKLWEEGVYEARMLASMLADPALLTPALMDRWTKQFDNWAVCDTMCFNLFDRSPHAFGRVDAWAKRKPEFEKRAAFALLACLALHRRGEEKDYLKRLPLIEAAASDDRNAASAAACARRRWRWRKSWRRQRTPQSDGWARTRSGICRARLRDLSPAARASPLWRRRTAQWLCASPCRRSAPPLPCWPRRRR
jgi:3-methyladenine DNA glycosylase AlkD